MRGKREPLPYPGICILKVLLFALIGGTASISLVPDTGASQQLKMGVKKQAAVSVALQPVLTTSLRQPVFMTTAHDGTNRLFIVEQAGPIKVLQPGATSPTMFLNLTPKVWEGGERGVLGLAFHPNYSTNRRFFVTYTLWPDGSVILAEYLASISNPNQAESTEKVILAIPHPVPIHNGGMIAFGPDNHLYFGLGDGGALPEPNHPAQNPDQLVGKILRINIDIPEGPNKHYTSPSGNPFFGSIPGRDEIFALGLRNPWRFSFDRLTGQIYVGDVGQALKEEVDIVTLGGNYGWATLEGTLCTGAQPELCGATGFTPPIAEYDHSGGACAIVGGYVYRGTQGVLPAGSYVFADHCSGEIALLEGGVLSLLLDTPHLISSFGEDESGEIYVVTYEGSGLYRIVNQVGISSLIIQMSQTSYGDGQVVTATEFRLSNTAATNSRIELKVSLTIPGIAPLSFLNFGADGSLILAPGADQNLAPLMLFVVNPLMPRGTYEFDSRLVDPVTGKMVSEDLNTFDIL